MRALLIVVASASCACATTGATPRPFPLPASATHGTNPARVSAPAGTPGETGALASAVKAGGYEISGTALALRGVPYRSGGADSNGFDCSGLVRYVFGQHGYSLPRRVADQFAAGGSVQPADLRPGDLVFFNTTGEGPSHVGIMVGGDIFVHAPASNGVVRVDTLDLDYWKTRFLGGRRIAQN